MVPNVVLDTNVLVSAFISPSIAPPSLCLDIIFSGKSRLILTQGIIEEYRVVLNRPKFKLEKVLIDSFFDELPNFSRIVTPKKYFQLCSDQDDNKFIEAAYAGKAPYLITGNTSHFPKLSPFTNIITPKQFIDLFI